MGEKRVHGKGIHWYFSTHRIPWRFCKAHSLLTEIGYAKLDLALEKTKIKRAVATVSLVWTECGVSNRDYLLPRINVCRCNPVIFDHFAACAWRIRGFDYVFGYHWENREENPKEAGEIIRFRLVSYSIRLTHLTRTVLEAVLDEKSAKSGKTYTCEVKLDNGNCTLYRLPLLTRTSKCLYSKWRA